MVAPTLPVVELSMMAGVTVNVAEAELELASVAWIVLLPAVEAGIVKITGVTKPELLDMVDATVEPSYLIVMTEEFAKPEPDTVTFEPAGPMLGDKEIVGIINPVMCSASLTESGLPMPVTKSHPGMQL
jgi:hypothetical protein